MIKPLYKSFIPYLLVLILILKYPFFEFAHRYTAATGESLLHGYRRLGGWALVLFMVIAVVSSVINAAAVLAGWSFGRGVTRYLDWFENTGTIVTAIAAVLLVFFALRWLVNRYMLRKR